MLPLVGAAAAVAGGVILLPAVSTAALGAVGFSAGGVAAGSMAAAAQSYFYGGLTGGVFSLLQSAGALGVVPAVGQMATGVTMVAGGVYAALRP